MKYQNIREEELKNKIAQEYFWFYDCSKIIGNVDFSVCLHQSETELFGQESLLWAEAKKGSSNIYNSIVQLILTIGKARTFDTFLPPAMLGAFDGEKIAFIPYNDIHEVFYTNDFNWNVTPSNHETKEFKLIHENVKAIIDNKTLLFNYLGDDKELKKFIKNNFIVGKYGLTKTKIDKNNFMVIYNKWLQNVKATISVNWDIAKKSGIIDGDFYLADLLSENNNTLKEKLFVLLKHDHYELDRKLAESGLFSHSETGFNDKQVAHTQFWNKYDRPPKEEYWDYIVERRDLLVPQDVRERKGSFFTPQIWVELSQKYLTDVLGEDWQDEYYIWDCASGTGNLLTGLTNKYNIWASTLDSQDVEVIHDRIKNGANLLDDHVFQFDFLNDDFTKLPKPLQEIINNPEKRKKLVIYINPPYKRGLGVANTNWHKDEMGEAKDELFAQFIYRIYSQMQGCIIAEFSKLKVLQAPNFSTLRKVFLAKLERMFVVEAETFDNVTGKFPIGFKIWNSKIKEFFIEISSDVYNNKAQLISQKIIGNYDDSKVINLWLKQFTINNNGANQIGILNTTSNDFQHQNRVIVVNYTPKGGDLHKQINSNNLIRICIYFTVRKSVEPTWLNDRDQFLYPNDGWKTDKEFQNDCLAFTLFNNNIQSIQGINNWIPFTEQEVNSREKFESNFMSQFIKGKIKPEKQSINIFSILLEPDGDYIIPLKFSPEATEVMDAGRELWIYYHKQPNCNVNASLYDIREHFQGRNQAGKMNNKSDDETYTELIGNIRKKLKLLAGKIEPKVYEYGFLKV
jgi:hypothetical protein